MTRAIVTETEKLFIVEHRIARMATADKSGVPYVVPVCYAYDGQYLFTPVDHKPKQVTGRELKRIRNIKENRSVSLVIDDYYDDDWSRLCHIIVHGTAKIMQSGAEYDDALRLLMTKYPQYRQANLAGLGLPVIKIVPVRIISWGPGARE